MEKQEQIRLMLERGHSLRKISESLKMCRRTVRRYTRRLSVVPGPEKSEVEKPREKEKFLPAAEWARELDWSEIVTENAKGVPAKTLFEERPEVQRKVTYWTFWKTLKKARRVLQPKTPDVSMRLNHIPGERVHVDYADGIDVVDPQTGEIRKTQLFVATMPFSGKIFAEFSWNQKIPSFIRSHENAWRFFGGVPKYTVCDNLKSAVTKASIYDPDVNKTFCEFANHCDFGVLPARPESPRDKASVESGVGVTQRSFYPRFRKRRFTSIGELNREIAEWLKEINASIMKDYGVSRDERSENEKDLLRPLPQERFDISEWKTARVHPDCHIQCLKVVYSVPWRHVGQEVRVRLTDKRVEVFDVLTLERLTTHNRSYRAFSRVTRDEHYPPEKLAASSFTIEIARREARKVGPQFSEFARTVFEMKHPLRFLRPVQGLLRLHSGKKHSKEAMEYAAAMCVKHKNFTSRCFKACCKHHDRGAACDDDKVRRLPPTRDEKHLHLHNKK